MHVKTTMHPYLLFLMEYEHDVHGGRFHFCCLIT